jgi:hypothetical protein
MILTRKRMRMGSGLVNQVCVVQRALQHAACRALQLCG